MYRISLKVIESGSEVCFSSIYADSYCLIWNSRIENSFHHGLTKQITTGDKGTLDICIVPVKNLNSSEPRLCSGSNSKNSFLVVSELSSEYWSRIWFVTFQTTVDAKCYMSINIYHR